MADTESDRLALALEHLFIRHCGGKSALKSKEYCVEFCKLVEEHTGRWQVPLPQLKVLRVALCSFTTAAAVFPADCQHIQYTLSSLAVSFFELMLFFSKEEFVEYPLRDIIDSFQACHSRLLRHSNVYMQQVMQVIKVGGPWESPVLQDILQEAPVPTTDVEQYLSSEVSLFLELRVRYLQACERLQEAMALAKSCLENGKAGKHLYFHQAYLTLLYKASLHEHMHKEMAEIDGHDAVEIICNTESVEKDELLLSLCRAFLNQQLQNGDMYYIWDLVFLWSRLFLRAHPSGEGFLLGSEGEQFCVELCARGLQLCDLHASPEIHSLLCKTIAFLLPYDPEVCQACALLVFCQERSLEAYKTVCLLYTHPGQEQHPHATRGVPTNIRFYILQVLKERLCFDPEFWNLLTLRTYCLELISDKAMRAAVLSEMEEDGERHNECGTKDSTVDMVCLDEHGGPLTEGDSNVEACSVPATAVLGSAAAASDGVLVFHNYCLQVKFEGEVSGDGEPQPPESTAVPSTAVPSQNGDPKLEGSSDEMETQDLHTVGTSKLSWRDQVLRREIYSHLRHFCTLCGKHFNGLNVMRHAISHLRGKQLECIFCGKIFKLFRLAKRHILEHIDEMCSRNMPGAEETMVPAGREGEAFKDEQVVIQEDSVILKDPSYLEEKGKPGEENIGARDFVYYLCPSGGCDKVFQKMNASLLKHAIKYHMKEDHVLEKTFLWSKSKCTICSRSMDFLQQYKDHMQLHDASDCYFCYHQDCNQRFLTARKMKAHVKTHRPLRAQCSNPGCEQVFPSLHGLYDHEWRHYIPVPQRREQEALASSVQKMPQNSEAPWKQRVKIEELCQSGKQHRKTIKAQRPDSPDRRPDSPDRRPDSPDRRPDSPDRRPLGENEESVLAEMKIPADSRLEIPPTSETPPKINDRSESLDGSGATPVNGHASTASDDVPSLGPGTPLPFEVESLDVKEYKTPQAQVLDTPQITQDKAPKCDAAGQVHFSSAPLIRLPPSAYLNESALSMPKRRGTPVAPTKEKHFAWRFQRKKALQQELREQLQQQQRGEGTAAVAEAAPANTRRRCNKCLVCFSTPRELEEHQALNKCSALFGFDTDDECE
ncbi:hypothetical protein NHX12_006849 [Muraenolepis orangiensis]|uniref:C2H2-type domain-containing protein n=1 Tax=Muraenolepis orangiensis TaxID=630683 RepID=A0A9Q0I955_9TELE|nr:hypothetical protein NHX12_006849 [Muraenolepis orangiensis]